VPLPVSTYLICKALVHDALEKLSAVLEARHSAVVCQLDMVQREMHILAASPTTVKNLAAFSRIYRFRHRKPDLFGFMVGLFYILSNRKSLFPSAGFVD